MKDMSDNPSIESKRLSADFLQNTSGAIKNVQEKASTMLDNITYWHTECKSHPNAKLFTKVTSCLSQSKDYSSKLCKSLRRTVDLCQSAVENLSKDADDNILIDSRPLELTPEEQELAYELKAQMMRNIQQHCDSLKTELAMQSKISDLEQKYYSATGKNRQQLQSELSRSNALRLMRLFERKAKDANNKFEALKQQLEQSKLLAKKYQEKYENAVKTAGGESSEPQVSSGKTKGQSNAIATMGTDALVRTDQWRSAEMLRRSEFVFQENEQLRSEIKQLRRENTEMMTKTKQAVEEKNTILTQLSTLQMARDELMTRLAKEQRENEAIKKSLSKQATDWITSMQNRQQSRPLTASANLRRRSNRVIVQRLPVNLYEQSLRQRVITPRKPAQGPVRTKPTVKE